MPLSPSTDRDILLREISGNTATASNGLGATYTGSTTGGVTSVKSSTGITRIDSGVDAASMVLKTSGGTLKTLYGYNSGSAGYILIFDSATVPADGNTTGRGFAVPGTGNFSLDVNTPYANGISLCISSTYATKTLATGSLNFVATVV